MSEPNTPLKIMFAQTASEQKFQFKISPAPGKLMTAETVGGCLVQMSKIIKSAALECGPGRVVALLAGIDFGETGEVTFALIGVPFDDERNPRGGEPRDDGSRADDENAEADAKED